MPRHHVFHLAVLLLNTSKSYKSLLTTTIEEIFLIVVWSNLDHANAIMALIFFGRKPWESSDVYCNSLQYRIVRRSCGARVWRSQKLFSKSTSNSSRVARLNRCSYRLLSVRESHCQLWIRKWVTQVDRCLTACSHSPHGTDAMRVCIHFCDIGMRDGNLTRGERQWFLEDCCSRIFKIGE